MDSRCIYVYMTGEELAKVLSNVYAAVPFQGFGILRGKREFRKLDLPQSLDQDGMGDCSVIFLREDPLDNDVSLSELERAPTVHGFMDVIMPHIYPGGFQREMMAAIRSKDTAPGVTPPDRLFRILKKEAYRISKAPLCYVRDGSVNIGRRYTVGAVLLSASGIGMGNPQEASVPCERHSARGKTKNEAT